jgi:pimeloyl-ACP methyl ester carboxylesterase
MKTIHQLVLTTFFLLISFTYKAQNTSTSFDVKISGSGKDVIIFIPGFGCSGDVWKETRSLYEKNHTCYTLTMAGFAGVPAQADPSFNSWKNEIAQFINVSKIEKPTLIGHSMGGALALAIAADYPELIGQVVVVDALPCLAALMNPSFKSAEKPDCQEIINQMKNTTDEQFYAMQKQSIPSLLADTTNRELVVGWTVKSDKATFGKMYCDFSNTDLRDKISSVKCPCLILLESYFVNFKPQIEDQYKNLKTAQLSYATKGLHFIMYDDPSWYTEQLLKFVK